ncbi:MAG TPA: HAMP domain-containing sensor histidine kinase [Candidatus Limnocylindrales bacterium]|nr:HAMP domain-containing sensor histidine kinase [Candidatus Limnocylindrales bacterium]
MAAPPPSRAAELLRFERTFNLARLGGAAITFVLGPFFPNIGIGHVILFGALLIAQAIFVAYVLRSGRFQKSPEPVSRLIFGIDLAVIAYAILLFSYDPNWTTYIIGLLLVIAGGFRFGRGGALVASVVMALTYVLVALYRERAFGFATEPYRFAFTVAIYVLAGFLLGGLVRELDALRAQRVAFEHQRAETEALRVLEQMKSEFLAEMSHDFRSPLTVVRGAVELLMSERPGALNRSQHELAVRAARNIHRLEEFAEDLLEMARIEHGGVKLERVEIDACELVREIVDDHRASAEIRAQSFDLECARAVTIFADVGRLRRAIGNLVGNAIKFAPERSTIEVRAGADRTSFKVRVTDHGPGVDADERDRIFEKFSRGRRSAAVAGAGLGLSIARSLVELHGGTVRYEEADGGGATFVLSVPLAVE